RSWAYSFCDSQVQRLGPASVPRAAAEMAADDLGLAARWRSLTPLAQACGDRFAPRPRLAVSRAQTIPSRHRQQACRRPTAERACASRRHGSRELRRPALWGRAEARSCAPPMPARPARSFGGATTDTKWL